MKLLAISLIIIAVTSCTSLGQYSTKIGLEGGEKPTFGLSGSEILSDFVVYGPRQRAGSDSRAFTVWEIQPDGKKPGGELLEKIGMIKYGEVPKGYKQIYPNDGSVPPVLVTGVRYAFWAQTTNAPHAREEFELIDGKAIVIPGNR